MRRIPSFRWFSFTPGAKLTRFSLVGGKRVSGVTGAGSLLDAPASHDVILPSSVCSVSRVSGVAASLPSVFGLKDAREAKAIADASSVAPTFSPSPFSSDFCLFGDNGRFLGSSVVSSITLFVELILFQQLK